MYSLSDSPRIRWSALLVFMVLLPACGSGFLYNRMDWVTLRYMEDYVEFEGEQQRFVRAGLQSVLEWHRQEELSIYLSLLETVEADVQETVDPEIVAAWADAGLMAYRRLQQQINPLLVQVAETLSGRQVDELLRSMDEKHAERQDKFLERDESEYRDDIFDNFVDHSEDWLGRLTSEQKDMLRSVAESFERTDQDWMKQREVWQRQVSDVLHKEPDWQARLLAVLNQRDPAYNNAGAGARNEQRIYATVAALVNMRTERQHQHLAKELKTWRERIHGMREANGNNRGLVISAR